MDNFEDLSNEQLRLKLLEYGLANMPVTQTTRKVLIKKLKNHLENVNSKVRRETIHVTKYSSDEDGENGVAEEAKKPVTKKETNRRATIGGSAAKLSKTLPVMPKLPPPVEKPSIQEKKIEPSQKRRSGRTTPVQTKDDTPVTAIPKEPAILENSDDDEEMPLTQQPRLFDRKSKSPSLSRGEMVTTSYVQVSSQPAINEEMEIDLTESTDEIVEPPAPVYEPEPKPKARQPPTTPSREYRYGPTIASESSSKRMTIGSSGLSQGFSTSFGRPSVTSPVVAPSASAAFNREDVNFKPTDSPYLSEFTKRLSRLKAESAQINAVRDHPIRRTIASSYAASPRDGGKDDYVQSRLATLRGSTEGQMSSDGKGEIRASMRQVILALDQKYSIRKAIYLLIVALIVVFLFVFFFL